MAILFSIAFNNTAKTLTVTITDYDGNADVDVYIMPPGETDYAQYADVSSPAASQDFYYSTGIIASGAETNIFPDGLYSIKVVPDADADLTDDTGVYVFSVINSKCCISGKIAKNIAYDPSDCKRNRVLEQLYFYKTLLEGAEFDGSTSCGDWTEAQTKLDFVAAYCATSTDGCYEGDC